MATILNITGSANLNGDDLATQVDITNTQNAATTAVAGEATSRTSAIAAEATARTAAIAAAIASEVTARNAAIAAVPPPIAPCNVSSLPAATQGLRGMAKDSTATLSGGLGNIVAGTGANIVPVYADGTNWRIG